MASVHFKRNLIHQATIQRNTPTVSADGELIPAWANVGSLDCRYVQKSERIASESRGFMMVLTDMLLCATGVCDTGETVAEDDRVTDIMLKSDSSTVNAGPFSVEALLGRYSTKAHHLSLQLKKVGGVT